MTPTALSREVVARRLATVRVSGPIHGRRSMLDRAADIRAIKDAVSLLQSPAETRPTCGTCLYFEADGSKFNYGLDAGSYCTLRRPVIVPRDGSGFCHNHASVRVDLMQALRDALPVDTPKESR